MMRNSGKLFKFLFNQQNEVLHVKISVLRFLYFSPTEMATRTHMDVHLECKNHEVHSSKKEFQSERIKESV